MQIVSNFRNFNLKWKYLWIPKTCSGRVNMRNRTGFKLPTNSLSSGSSESSLARGERLWNIARFLNNCSRAHVATSRCGALTKEKYHDIDLIMFPLITSITVVYRRRDWSWPWRWMYWEPSGRALSWPIW